MPHAILLDLDETLMDHTLSITQYAERFQRDFVDAVSPLPVPALATTIMTADQRGYRPREALYADFLQQHAWQQRPEIGRLRTHWEIWFPASSVARVGLHETLGTRHAQGIRLGVITNGAVGRQQPKIATLQIRPYLSTVVISEAVQVKKPDPRIFTLALTEVGCTASRAWFVGDHPVNNVLGAAAVGCRAIWLRGVHPWPPAHPVPAWHIGALPELVALVQQERHLTT